MCLEHGGLEYEAKNVLRGDLDWPAMKVSSDAPFDQLPVLLVDGKPIAQCAACAHVIGKIAGTDGGDDIADYGMSSMLISEMEDIYKVRSVSSSTRHFFFSSTTAYCITRRSRPFR
jgi:hypothetical protein